MPRKYTQLSREERDRLSLLNAQGLSLREIGCRLGRNVSTVSRELNRNANPFEPNYLPHQAQEFTEHRQSKGHQRERLRAPRLKGYVTKMLKRGWSPERIAGRWKFLARGRISHEAIYQWIYADARNLVPLLLRAHRRRSRFGRAKRPRSWAIPSRTPIQLRPPSISLREEAGHWECDTIIGKRCASALCVLVERKTRFVHLEKLPAKTAAAMRASLVRKLGRYPRRLRRSLTYDNGIENTQHVQTNQRLGTASYFCVPMHSWEKGSVENVAGLVRRHWPKKTDFNLVTDEQLQETEDWINSLPKKCLGFRTPTEARRSSVALAG